MKRYTIRGYKYGDTECPMSKLQDLENKIEDGVLVEAVKCKDCRNIVSTEYGGFCCLKDEGVAYNDYCYYGEKRKEHNDGKAD